MQRASTRLSGMNETRQPLWQQLQATAAALQAVRQGQSLTA